MRIIRPNSALFLLLFFFFTFSAGHAQQWDWVSSAGGPNSDKALDIDMDKYGNQYVCGYYNTPTSGGDVNFGVILPGSDFGKEAFLAKIDSSGQWQWVKSAFGGWDERALGLCVDKANDAVYVTGTAWVYTDFGSCTGTSYPGSYDNVFLGKFDLFGNCQWLIGCGGQYDDHGYDMVTDKQGNIYLTGFLGNTYSGTPTTATFGSLTSAPIPPGDSLAFVTKINPAGVFQWVRTFDATDGERDNRIAIDSLDNIYITGGFHETAQFGLYTVTAIGGRDVFVVKFDPLGNLLWVNTAGSPLDDRGNGITRGPDNQMYVTGEFRSQIGFGTDSLNNNGGPGGRDIFVAKINRYGGWVWAKKAGSDEGSDRGNRIAANRRDMMFVTGQFRGNARFGGADSLFNSSDSIQIFVAAIDTTGKWHWAIQAGGDVEDRGTGIVADDSCNVYACGFYELTASFGSTNVTAEGRKDIYVAKIPSACQYLGVDENEHFPNLVCYPNPSSGNFSIDLGRQRKKISVLVYNVMGEVLTDRTYEQVSRIDLTLSASAGIYFIRVISGDESRTVKVVKQ